MIPFEIFVWKYYFSFLQKLKSRVMFTYSIIRCHFVGQDRRHQRAYTEKENKIIGIYCINVQEIFLFHTEQGNPVKRHRNIILKYWHAFIS